MADVNKYTDTLRHSLSKS